MPRDDRPHFGCRGYRCADSERYRLHAVQGGRIFQIKSSTIRVLRGSMSETSGLILKQRKACMIGRRWTLNLPKRRLTGRRLFFGIPSGGVNVPDWLLADYPDIQTFTFIDPNPHSSTYGQPVTIPVFWDPIFLAKKIALIQAAGARYAANPNIVVVSCAFANATEQLIGTYPTLRRILRIGWRPDTPAS